jgi:hypothetical protein
MRILRGHSISKSEQSVTNSIQVINVFQRSEIWDKIYIALWMGRQTQEENTFHILCSVRKYFNGSLFMLGSEINITLPGEKRRVLWMGEMVWIKIRRYRTLGLFEKV